MTLRLDNWPTKLERCRERHERMAFEWGKSDCICFAADCVEAMTGTNPHPYKGSYKTQEGAKRLIRRYGGIESAIDTALRPYKPFKTENKTLGRGDVVLIDFEGKQLAGVWFGHFALAPFPDKGLCRVPINYVKQGWAIL